MASVKVKFRPSSIDGKEGSICYQVIHNRVVRQIRTDYRIFENEWNGKTLTVVVPVWASDERKNYLQSVVRCIEWDIKRLRVIISLYDKRNGIYTTDDIVAKFDKQANEQSLFSFMQEVIGQLKRLNRIRTSETYAATLSSFMKFRNGQDILLCEVNSDTMMLYEAWLKTKGICPNTVSFYMRILRAVYNRAVEKELVEQKHPFKHVYTGIDKTVKRAVPLKAIKRIKELDLTLKPHLDYARDMFLFSFYTRGMSFIDMAYLKMSDLKNGVITYRRKKTSQQLSIKWEKCMAEIVTKYKDRSATQYLLPIITDPLADERIQYRNALCRINVALKEVARLASLSIPLTMYCGRHSWASIAKSKNIPISVISEGMGHDSEETTRIYLASLDSNVIDKANSLILKDL
ncbi:integrase [Alistipes sp. An116]|uniref:tyrosine-type recombinase/integrase n=1 Tax=Alistipes sp. An116 TaxID=1965546 RepID=UPI000B39CEEA|nr:site-specific integrase [Alistipes sp. An116]OUQ50370.1 integrase [Alistipes sp. An116]